MPWAFTTVSATTTGTFSGSASTTTGAAVSVTANLTSTLQIGAQAVVTGSCTVTTSAQVSNGVVSSLVLLSGGSGYPNSGSLTFTGGGGSGATGTFTASSGVITSVSLTNGGSGYTSSPTVTAPTGTGLSVTVYTSSTVSINSVGTNNGFNTTSGTTDFAGATFTNSGTVHTVTAATATSLTVTPAIAVTINSGTQITLSRQAVYSVTAVAASTVTLFPQTGASVPAITTGTSLTFYNPLVQSGSDISIGTALEGLASFRSNIINAFIDNAGGYASGATSMVIDNGSGAAPAIAPTPTTTFLNSTRVHRVTSYNAGTRTITFSPALNATIANDAAITLFAPGVIVNRGDGATGLDSYTVNSTRVRITGTFTMNAWAEQLVIASSCPSDPVAQLTFAGTVTLNGLRGTGGAWGSGSGSICPTPVLMANLEGNSSIGNQFLFIASGTTTFNNCTIQASSYIDTSQGSNPGGVTFTNATFLNNAGSPTGSGNIFYYSALNAINSINFTGYRHTELSASDGTIRSNISADGTAGFNTGILVTGSYTLQNLSARNMATVFVFRNFTFTSIGSTQTIALNNLTGSNPGIAAYADGFTQSGGHLLIQKQVAHSLKNLSGASINAAKVYAIDTLNLQRFNWVSSGTNRSGYTSGIGLASQQTMPAIAIAGSATLTNNTTPANSWDANSQRSYLWTADSSGATTAQTIALAYVSNPNRRIIGINCVSNGVANVGATTINVDNGTGLFANLGNDIGAPQINGYFVWAGTRHIITSVTLPGSLLSIAVTSGGSGYTTAPAVTIAAPSSGITALAAAILGTGAFAGTVVSIVIALNGSGYTTAPAVTIAAPPVGAGNTTATASATIYPSANTDYVLSISPALAAQVPDNTALPVQNIWYDCRNKTRVSAFIDNAAGYTVNYLVTVQNAQIAGDTTITLTATPSVTPASGWTFINNNIVHTASDYNTTTRALTFSPPLNLDISASTTITLRNSTISSIVVDNGADALLATTPVPYTNFVYGGEIYLITAVSSSSTEHTLTISPSLRASIADNATITLENIPGSDFFDFYVCSYPHLLQQQELNLTGTGTLTNNWTLLADPLIVQTNIATARNRTPTLASHVYDGLKAWLYDNFAGQTAVLVNRNGSILDAFAYNVVLNSSAANNYNFASNTITLKTNNFTDTLTTTGVITLSQPGTYSSGIVPSGGKLVIAANGTYNLTGWTLANGSTIEDTATGTVNLSLNYEATAITNNSSGITLSNTGGGTLTVTYKTNTLSAPNFATDTKAYGASIISGTETQLFSTTLASAGLTQGSIELLTGTQVRVKAAYWSNASGSWVAGNFLDTTLSWSAQSSSSVASQIGPGNPDPSITQANRTTVEGYTSITTAAQLYDRAKLHLYNNYTATNFTSAPLVTRTGTTLNAGSYNLTLATSGSVFALSGNTITINAPTFTDTLTTTGTISLNNPSTTAINYASGSVPAGGTLALATAGTYDLSGWTFATGSTISNISGGSVTVWLYPAQVGNAVGSGANLTIVAKPQPLLAPNLADGTRAYAARVQIFSIAASVAVNTTSNELSLGLDLQGKAADFATAAPWTQVRFSLQPGATLPSTTGNVLKDGGFYYWSNNKLYTSIANIPGTPVDFLTTGSGSFTIQAETELFNTTVSGSTGLSQSLIQPDGIQIRLKATRWAVDGSGNASATQFLDTRDSLITWSAFTGATVSTTLELEAVHEQIVATSYVQSGKYGQLFPAKRGDQFGSKFSIALEGVGTLQINADDDTNNPAGVELLQDIFLWACYVRGTPEGMRLWSYDTFQAINFTTYQAGRVEVENTDASVPLIIAGGSISFAGSSNGIAATSNAIYLNVDVLGVVAITGVAAADIRSAVGLGSANLDSQLGDITALVL